jgi:hypothetical protein
MIDAKPTEMRAAALALLRVAADRRPSARDVAAAIAERFGVSLSEKTVRRWAERDQIGLTARPIRKDRRHAVSAGGEKK